MEIRLFRIAKKLFFDGYNIKWLAQRFQLVINILNPCSDFIQSVVDSLDFFGSAFNQLSGFIETILQASNRVKINWNAESYII